MKKFYFLLLFQMAALALFAQVTPAKGPKSGPDVPATDKKEIQGLTVKIKGAAKGTYLFSIEQGPLALNNAGSNPATMLPKGFATKGDAFKVAEWMIKQYKKDGFLPAVVPPHVLDQLSIDKKQLLQN